MKNIIFSDESHIYLNRFISKQNFRKWSSENRWDVFEKVLHSPKVTVYGPYFFEDPANSNNVRTVTSEAYIDRI